MDNNIHEKIHWTNSVPIFQRSIILKQLGIAVGIPFGLVIVFLLISSRGSKDALYGVGLIILTFLLTYALIKIVYGGMYKAEFIVDDEGVQCILDQKQGRKNKIVNTLTVLAGFLSQKPAVAGAGILAGSRSHVSIPWKEIRKVKYIDKEQLIVVKGNFSENIALFCTKENYSGVKEFIRGKSND